MTNSQIVRHQTIYFVFDLFENFFVNKQRFFSGCFFSFIKHFVNNDCFSPMLNTMFSLKTIAIEMMGKKMPIQWEKIGLTPNN